MMMLLLIHLDAYAYEVISACQVDTQDEMAIPSAADTFQEEDVNVLSGKIYLIQKPLCVLFSGGLY